jgi:predicted aspartyl protease
MIGEVNRTKQDGYTYRERLYDRAKGNALVMQMGTVCRRPEVDTRAEEKVQKPPRDAVPIYLDAATGHKALIDVIIGGQPVRMLIDTGATVCQVSSAIAEKMLAAGEATAQENKQFKLADGSVVSKPTMLVKTIRIGSHVVQDIVVLIEDRGSMLLSFPVLNSIAPFTINTRTQELIFDQVASD